MNCATVRGQLSSKLIELASARAGITASKHWPSAVTSNKGAHVSTRFIGLSHLVVHDDEIVLYAEHTRNRTSLRARDLLVHRTIHHTIQFYMAIVHDDADGRLGVDRILLQGGMGVYRASDFQSQLMVEWRRWKYINLINDILDAWFSCHDGESRVTSRVVAHIAGDRNHSVLHAIAGEDRILRIGRRLGFPRRL